MKKKEIELKCTMPSEELELLNTWLYNNGQFIKDEWLCDYYFDDVQESFYNKDKVLRVRFSPNSYVLCYKQWYRNTITGERTYCDEYEIVVEDGERTKQLLVALGYHIVVVVEKKRKTFYFNGFEIALDDVKNLGNFVEIELAHDVEDVDAGICSIYGLLGHIGIHKFEVQRRGYSSMARAQLKK